MKVMREAVAAEAVQLFPSSSVLPQALQTAPRALCPWCPPCPDFVSALFSFCGVVSVSSQPVRLFVTAVRSWLHIFLVRPFLLRLLRFLRFGLRGGSRFGGGGPSAVRRGATAHSWVSSKQHRAPRPWVRCRRRTGRSFVRRCRGVFHLDGHHRCSAGGSAGRTGACAAASASAATRRATSEGITTMVSGFSFTGGCVCAAASRPPSVASTVTISVVLPAAVCSRAVSMR